MMTATQLEAVHDRQTRVVADEIDKKIAVKVSTRPLVTYGKGRPLLVIDPDCY